MPKPANSQKKIVQYSIRARTCHQSEKDGKILKQSKTCHLSEKHGTKLKECKNLSPARKIWYNSQIEPKPVNSEKKRWCNSQTVAKPANSLKKIVQYSIRARTCHQSEKDGKIVKQSNLPTVRKKERGAKHATSNRTQQKTLF